MITIDLHDKKGNVVTQGVKIDLHNRKGDVIAQAIVDQQDYEEVSKYRWSKAGRYVQAKVNGKMISLHRFLLKLYNRKIHGDHKNGDGLNNSVLTNLRAATPAQNLQNRPKKDGCSSIWKGVCFDKTSNVWRCQVGDDLMGKYQIESHAAYAYNLHAVEKYGDGSLLNDIAKPNDFKLAPLPKRRNAAMRCIYKICGTYYLRMTINGKLETLGSFKSEQEAIKARDEYDREKAAKIKTEILSKPILRDKDQNCIIPLTNSEKFAIVDEEDYHDLIRDTYSLTAHGYARNNRTQVDLHLHLLKVHPDLVVDHKDRNKLNNKKSNLRPAPYGLNNHNKDKLENATSQYFGVHTQQRQTGVMFVSTVSFNHENYYAGTYMDEDVAGFAADNMARRLYGDDANVNNIAAPEGWIWDDKNDRCIKIEDIGFPIQRNKNSTSKFIGVHKKKNQKYAVCVGFNGKLQYAGTYDLELHGAYAYDFLSKYLYGDKNPPSLNNVPKPKDWEYRGDQLIFESDSEDSFEDSLDEVDYESEYSFEDVLDEDTSDIMDEYDSEIDMDDDEFNLDFVDFDYEEDNLKDELNVNTINETITSETVLLNDKQTPLKIQGLKRCREENEDLLDEGSLKHFKADNDIDL